MQVARGGSCKCCVVAVLCSLTIVIAGTTLPRNQRLFGRDIKEMKFILTFEQVSNTKSCREIVGS